MEEEKCVPRERWKATGSQRVRSHFSLIERCDVGTTDKMLMILPGKFDNFVRRFGLHTHELRRIRPLRGIRRRDFSAALKSLTTLQLVQKIDNGIR